MAIWEWLKSNKSNNGTLLLGAAATFVFNGLLTVGLINRSERHSEELLKEQFVQAVEIARNQEIRERASEVRNAAADFSTFAAAYVSAVLENEEQIPNSKRRLQDNVINQLSTLQMAGNIFDGQTKKAASEYTDALFAFSDALVDADTVLEMRPFWEGASSVLVARDALLKAIDQQS